MKKGIKRERTKKDSRTKLLPYIQAYIRLMQEALDNPDLSKNQLRALLKEHQIKLAWFQHERLVHVLIMMLTIILFFISLGLLLTLQENVLLLVLCLVLAVMSSMYIFYYYRLENCVQSLYELYDRLKTKISRTE